MTRYYYSDQLKAAYMAREFGMRFLRPDGSEVNLSHGMGGKWAMMDGLSFIAVPNDGDYIHPDSLSILQPQEGDKDEDGFVFSEQTQAWRRECGEDENGPILREKSPEESQTEKRNGRPFFWPECEE